MANSIYEELVDRVSAGERFVINFEKRSMRVGRSYLIKDGEFKEERALLPEYAAGNILSVIEELYQEYKFSLPSEWSGNRRKSYFKALPVDQLTDRQMVIGERRDLAQAKLEGMILCAALAGDLKWDEQAMGKWFWQSKTDPDLVVLRKWIDNNN